MTIFGKRSLQNGQKNLVMIINFQNRLSGSRDMTIFGKRSLQNRKNPHLNAHNV